jgi:hypothetical protein
VPDGDRDDEDDTGPVRLWPAAVALGLAAVLAATVAVVVLADGDQQAGNDAESVMRIVLVAPAGGRDVRLVTAERGCRVPTTATADLRADAIAFSVTGRDPGGGCPDIAKVRCNEVQLSQAVGPRRVLPGPVAGLREQAESVLAGGCARIPVEED